MKTILVIKNPAHSLRFSRIFLKANVKDFFITTKFFYTFFLQKSGCCCFIIKCGYFNNVSRLNRVHKSIFFVREKC